MKVAVEVAGTNKNRGSAKRANSTNLYYLTFPGWGPCHNRDPPVISSSGCEVFQTSVGLSTGQPAPSQNSACKELIQPNILCSTVQVGMTHNLEW